MVNKALRIWQNPLWSDFFSLPEVSQEKIVLIVQNQFFLSVPQCREGGGTGACQASQWIEALDPRVWYSSRLSEARYLIKDFPKSKTGRQVTLPEIQNP